MNCMTMYKISPLFSLLFLITVIAKSQSTPQKTLGSTYRPDTIRQADIRERLVQMALQNPQFEVADRKVAVADYQLRMAKSDWLSPIQAQANLNQQTLMPAKNGVIFYPLYNIAVTVPLSFLTTHRNTVRVARENLLISEAEKNEQYRKIRAAVLSKYEDYLMYKAKLERQSRITQDTYLNYKQREKDFQDGLIMIEEYNKSFQVYSDQQDQKDQAQRNLNVTKIELEEMIGGNLDDVLGKK